MGVALICSNRRRLFCTAFFSNYINEQVGIPDDQYPIDEAKEPNDEVHLRISVSTWIHKPHPESPELMVLVEGTKDLTLISSSWIETLALLP